MSSEPGYIRFTVMPQVARTIQVSDTVFLDLDSNNKVIGVECLDADPALPVWKNGNDLWKDNI